jgi:hypothetical protein
VFSGLVSQEREPFGLQRAAECSSRQIEGSLTRARMRSMY